MIGLRIDVPAPLPGVFEAWQAYNAAEKAAGREVISVVAYILRHEDNNATLEFGKNDN